MRAAVVFLVVASAPVWVFGKSLYGEKEEAVEEIEKKYADVSKYAIDLLDLTRAEWGRNEEKAEEDVHKEVEGKILENLEEFSGAVMNATRLAIVEGKPLSCIDCIYKKSFKGRDAILGMQSFFQKAVEDLKQEKKDVLGLTEKEIMMIGLSIRALIEESRMNISEAKNGFQSVKNDVLDKLDWAKKLFEEIERRIPKPVLLDELLKTKERVALKCNEVMGKYLGELRDCLGSLYVKDQI